MRDFREQNRPDDMIKEATAQVFEEAAGEVLAQVRRDTGHGTDRSFAAARRNAIRRHWDLWFNEIDEAVYERQVERKIRDLQAQQTLEQQLEALEDQPRFASLRAKAALAILRLGGLPVPSEVIVVPIPPTDVEEKEAHS
jgi:hypothetical protein